jgi:molybdenum cofactor cytidylyltransferase
MALTSAILLAAGASSRMGRPKPLLQWHGVTLLEYQTANLLDAGVGEVVVVVGYRHEAVAPLAKGPGVRCVVNPRYMLGKTTSIKAGLQVADADAEGILLQGVDQPRPPEVITTILEAHTRSGALISSPRYRGRGGHPIVFSSLLRTELEAISEERQGIREVLLAHESEVNEVVIDDPIIRLDLNSPQEYEEARSRYGA